MILWRNGKSAEHFWSLLTVCVLLVVLSLALNSGHVKHECYMK